MGGGGGGGGEKLHPLSRVLVVADGVMTTGEVVALDRRESGDALLVTDDQGGGSHFERVGALTAWAGLALLDPKRIAEVAAMPKDYDFQSTLLRVAAQAGPAQVRLPAGAAGGAHGIERDSRRLAERGKAILSALAPVPTPWADRFVLAPLALPRVAASGWTEHSEPCRHGAWLRAGAGRVRGTILRLAAYRPCAGRSWPWPDSRSAAPLSALRDETIELRIQQGAMLAVPAWPRSCLGGILPRAWSLQAARSSPRAGRTGRQCPRSAAAGGGSPAAYPMLMLPLVALGQPLAALVAARIYAFTTLGAAIEAFREKP